MNKNNSQNLEVLEVKAEEIPLEEVINRSLVKANVTDQVIAELKERYGGMKLKSIGDKESYLEIVDARKAVRKIGIITESLCKKGREDAVREQKLWLAKQNEILGKIDTVQLPLEAEMEKFEKEVERKEIEDARKLEEIFMDRQHALLKMGAVYGAGSFHLNHLSYESEVLKQADNDMWNDTILPKYRKEFEANEAEKVTLENKRKDDFEKQKKELEEFEAQQKKFRQEQEDFRKQQAELQKQKEAHEREQRLIQERKDAEQKQKEYTARFIEEGKKREEEAIQKALADQKFKEQHEAEQKELELAQSKDKAKWQAFVATLNTIVHSEMKSPTYKRKQQIAKEKLSEIINL